jgi:hypothetical protein
VDGFHSFHELFLPLFSHPHIQKKKEIQAMSSGCGKRQWRHVWFMTHV